MTPAAGAPRGPAARPPLATVARIVAPPLLTALLFVVAIYVLMIPALERSVMHRKREMIRELTVSAWNILANFEEQEREGRLTREQAQAQAIIQVRHLHYGPHQKDYFWINDLHPRMIMHPYRMDLEGRDLTDYTDPDGKRIFMEASNLVRREGEGYLLYRWQRRDQTDRIQPKISFVKGFTPWAWIIGTGVYLDDVHAELRQARRRLTTTASGILALVAVLLAFMSAESLRNERRRRTAEAALRESEARYRMTVESAGESILMSLGTHVHANPNALALLGVSAEALQTLALPELLGLTPAETGPDAAPFRREAHLRARNGAEHNVLLSWTPVRVGDRHGYIVVLADITRRKQAEEALENTAAELRARVTTLENTAGRQQDVIVGLRAAVGALQAPDEDSTPARLRDRVAAAPHPQALAEINRDLPRLMAALLNNGAQAMAVNHLLSRHADAVTRRLLDLALAALGPPPVRFALLVMGSQGRHEQTLKTDQDNAIVYADPPPEGQAAARDYFLALGAHVCRGLEIAGYAACAGGIMASSPDWCRPLSAWRELCARWIDGLEAQDLLKTKIFFDFRVVAGDEAMGAELTPFLRERLAGATRFYAQMTRGILFYNPPLGLFGGLTSETHPEQGRGIEIKEAMVPLVDVARLYALRHAAVATGTVERLRAVEDAGGLPRDTVDACAHVYRALMQIRLEHQIRAVAEGRAPDNFLDLKTLTRIERRLLKEAFGQIRDFQARVRYTFTGATGELT